MPLNAYHFVTHWRVPGSLAEVGAILGDGPGLVRWWPSVYLEVQEIQPGDSAGVGTVLSMRTTGWLPYQLRWQCKITAVRDNGFSLEALGDFVGRGDWTLAQAGPWVELTYDWQIVANKPLLRWLSPLLKPSFAANHHWAMAQGEASLKLELARRQATSAAERARIPAPPPATSAAAIILAAIAALGCAGMIWWIVRQILQRSAR